MKRDILNLKDKIDLSVLLNLLENEGINFKYDNMIIKIFLDNLESLNIDLKNNIIFNNDWIYNYKERIYDYLDISKLYDYLEDYFNDILSHY